MRDRLVALWSTWAVLVAFKALFLVPFGIYLIRGVRLNQRTTMIAKRRPDLIIEYIVLLMVYPFIREADSAMHLDGVYGRDIPRGFSWFITGLAVPQLTNVAVRLWLLSVDWERSQAQLRNAWLSLLNPELVDETSCTQRHPSLRNPRFCRLLAFAFFIFVQLLIGVLVFTNKNGTKRDSRQVAASFLAAVVFLFFAVLVVSFHRVRGCRDLLLIRQEVSIYCAIVLGVFTGRVVILLLAPKDEALLAVLSDAVITVAMTAALVFGVYPVVKLAQQDGCRGASDSWQKRTMIVGSRRSSITATPSTMMQSPERASLQRFYAVLGTKDGFELLASHLARELCVESLLFLFHYLSFKRRLRQSYAAEELQVEHEEQPEEEDKESRLGWWVPLDERVFRRYGAPCARETEFSAPHGSASATLGSEVRSEQRLLLELLLLHVRYTDHYAEQAVNITSAVRRRVTRAVKEDLAPQIRVRPTDPRLECYFSPTLRQAQSSSHALVELRRMLSAGLGRLRGVQEGVERAPSADLPANTPVSAMPASPTSPDTGGQKGNVVQDPFPDASPPTQEEQRHEDNKEKHTATTTRSPLHVILGMLPHFDAAAEEVVNLMLRDSYVRFTRTPEYAQFVTTKGDRFFDQQVQRMNLSSNALQ